MGKRKRRNEETTGRRKKFGGSGERRKLMGNFKLLVCIKHYDSKTACPPLHKAFSGRAIAHECLLEGRALGRWNNLKVGG